MSATPDVGWFVNRPPGVDEASTNDYLAEGVWVSPTPAGHARLLRQMRAGEPVALKSVANRSLGLPFFNADRTVAVMTIHAIGEVRSVDADTGRVKVAWAPLAPARDWYFYTGMHALWRVTADQDAFAHRLLDFAFNGAEQDLAPFLEHVYWRDRYPPQPGFSWVPFYTEFATRLAGYQRDRGPLLAALSKAAEAEPLLRYLTTDQYADGGTGPLGDIDPFTTLGTFNRSSTDDNRRRVAAMLADTLRVGAPLPQDFHGIPVLSPIKSWFFSYEKDRDPQDIDRLWEAFVAALDFAEEDSAASRERFAAAYDAALAVRGVNWNLSQGLFWARPETFATLDGFSRPFIQRHFGLAIPRDGAGYLRLLDALRGRFESGTTSIVSYALLSHAAWYPAPEATKERTLAGLATWAVRMAESIDLDATEHAYKRATGEAMRAARDALRAGDATWPDAFKVALRTADNLLNYRFRGAVEKAAAAAPDTWADILGAVWDEPAADSFEPLHERLKAALGYVSPGDATGLGALLCLAGATERNAPYRPTVTDRWYALTGFDGPGGAASPTERYATLLRFLDALADELERQTGDRPSRLETQGMAWAATEEPIPADWDDAARVALDQWRRGAEPMEPPRAWLVQAPRDGLHAWLEEGFVSMPAARLRGVEPGADRKAIAAAVESGLGQHDYAEREALTDAFHAFLSRMRPEDLVCTLAEGRLHIGRIAGAPSFADAGKDTDVRRDAKWLSAVPTEPDLPAPLPALFEQPGKVVDLTTAVDTLEALLDAPAPGYPHIAEPAPEPEPLAVAVGVQAGPPQLPPVPAALATSLHVDAAALQEIVDLLQSRQQVVLYGPPGTGKTYLALALARHLVGKDHPNRHRLVQFHPSYAYEDFFEGFRPCETATGQATFKIEPGPLRRIASAAHANPGAVFVLVIDEINRANLAKVFGELYFLLEYRDRSIQLQYNPGETFQLPRNLYFIATMNTADRSIALLDAAMRRRFAFVELHPDEPPVRDVLDKYLAAKGGDGDPRAGLLAALNRAIDDSDRDFKIGPSYLMRPEAETATGLARIWRHDILPLLEEHYYGRMSRAEVHARFGLEALRQGIDPAPAPAGSTAGVAGSDAGPDDSPGGAAAASGNSTAGVVAE